MPFPSALQPRPGVYELYWRFASQRQAIFERRVAGARGPWTDDPILQRFKFCNVYRAADRISQYMIRDVIYRDADDAPADRLFRIVAFRTFSNSTTWDALRDELGHAPQLLDLRSGRFARALDRIKQREGGLYTGAFILCANKAFGYDEKHLNHVALFKEMFVKKDLADGILRAPSLRSLVALLESFPLTGPFMSYQIAIDLNYSDLVNFDENDYTQAGPGALRGIKKAFVSTGQRTPADVIRWMVDHQNDEFRRLGLPFNGLWGRPLHAIDCQGLFCELDKYCREAVPELSVARKRIKAVFRPNPSPLPLFFPPKWNLNDRLPTVPPGRQDAGQSPSLFVTHSG